MNIVSKTNCSTTDNKVCIPGGKLFDVADGYRALTPTFSDYLKQTELLIGRPYAAHMALLFSSSSQISRDPLGEYGSKLHMDMITGNDERIGFSFLS